MYSGVQGVQVAAESSLLIFVNLCNNREQMDVNTWFILSILSSTK